MTSENMPEKAKKSYSSMKSCICDAINKTKETYFECDFDIGERIHSGNSQNQEINMFKNGNIKIRLFDVIAITAVMGSVMAIMKLFKK